MAKRIPKFFVSFCYCITFKEVLNCFASENYYSLLLMLNLMHNCEIRKATVCYAHYLRSA